MNTPSGNLNTSGSFVSSALRTLRTGTLTSVIASFVAGIISPASGADKVHKWEKRDQHVSSIEVLPGTGSTHVCKFSSVGKIPERRKAEILEEASKIVDEYKIWFEGISIRMYQRGMTDATWNIELKHREELEKQAGVFENRIGKLYDQILSYDIRDDSDADFLKKFIVFQWNISHSLRRYKRSGKKEIYDLSSDARQIKYEIGRRMNFKCAPSVDIDEYIPDLEIRISTVIDRAKAFDKKLTDLGEEVMNQKPIEALDYEHRDIVYAMKEIALEASIVRNTMERTLFTDEEREMFRYISTFGSWGKTEEKLGEQIKAIPDKTRRDLLQKVYDMTKTIVSFKNISHSFEFFDGRDEDDEKRLPYNRLAYKEIDPIQQTGEFIERYLYLYKHFKKFRDYTQDIYRGTLAYGGAALGGPRWASIYVENAAKHGYYFDIHGGTVHRKILSTTQIKPSNSDVIKSMFEGKVPADILEREAPMYRASETDIEDDKLIMLGQSVTGPAVGRKISHIDGIFVFNDDESTKVNELTHLVVSRFFEDDDILEALSKENLTPLIVKQDPRLAEFPAMNLTQYNEFLSDSASMRVKDKQELDAEIERILAFSVYQALGNPIHPGYEYSAAFMMDIIRNFPAFRKIDWQEKDPKKTAAHIMKELTDEQKQKIIQEYIKVGDALISQIGNIKLYVYGKFVEGYLNVFPHLIQKGVDAPRLGDLDITSELIASDPTLKEVGSINLAMFWELLSIGKDIERDSRSTLLKIITLLQQVRNNSHQSYIEELETSDRFFEFVLAIAGDIVKNKGIDWTKKPEEILDSIDWDTKYKIIQKYEQLGQKMFAQVLTVKKVIDEKVPQIMRQRREEKIRAHEQREAEYKRQREIAKAQGPDQLEQVLGIQGMSQMLDQFKYEYTVEAGDTLWAIVKDHYEDTGHYEFKDSDVVHAIEHIILLNPDNITLQHMKRDIPGNAKDEKTDGIDTGDTIILPGYIVITNKGGISAYRTQKK